MPKRCVGSRGLISTTERRLMHAARVEKSDRLQRVLKALSDGAEHSTRELIVEADVCAVNAIVAELRENGHSISCRQTANASGRVWFYKLEAAD